jgi:CheY-like chemotaxis protein
VIHTPSKRPTRIAVVDDDTVFLGMMVELMQGEGYEATAIKGSAQAYERLKALRHDLVILDVRMGGEEAGWQVLDLLKRDPTTSHISMIACSAAIGSLRERADTLRQYDVRAVEKPFDVQDLLGQIEDALCQAPPPPP